MIKLLKTTFFIFCIVLLISITGCKKENSYTLSFNTQGGNSISSMTVKSGEDLTLPTPTKEGRTFIGWYVDEECNEAFTKTSMPKKDLVLYAKWEVNQYIINFESNGGTLVNPITQDYYTDITKPNDPVREGYTFAGWYSDRNLSHQFRFSKMPVNDITLYAKWEINQYTISFESNGGTDINSITQEYNSNVTEPTAPVKEGYTFIGWNSDSELSIEYDFEKMPSEDITLYAKWEINQYTITFETNSGSNINPITQNYNTPVIQPVNPTRDNYLFLGWFMDQALTIEYDFDTMPAENITLYAKWLMNGYTITFESNGGSVVDSMIAVANSNITAPFNPVKEGYTFNGWYRDDYLSTEFIFNTMPPENITLYAKWDANHYTITFNTSGGNLINSITQDYNTTITAPLDPIKDGYSFIGWYQDSSLTTIFNFTTMPAHNITLYAKWDTNQYTITFDSNGGSAVNSIIEDYQRDIFKPANPIKEGYTFVDWYSDYELTTLFIFDTMPAHDITLYAKWNVNQYTISFESNGGSLVSPITQDYHSIITQPENPSKEYYTFAGWFIDNELTTIFVFDTMPADNITLYAKWQINQYTITFDSNGGSNISPITQDYASTITEPVSPTKLGYTFAGWYSDYDLTTVFVFNTMPAQNITLYAKWDTNQYTITFESNGGSLVESITQDYNSYVTQPVSPTKFTYLFAGWYRDPELTNEFVFDTMPFENIILYAKWDLAISNVAYTLKQDGTYEITGCFEIFDHTLIIPSYYHDAPVTSIGNYAFSGETYDNIIFLEDSQIKTIGTNAFSNNDYITSITLPDGLETIKSYAFSNSDILATISIPSSVTTIEENAFIYLYKLSSINVDANNLTYKSIDGVLYNAAQTLLIKYPIDKPGTTYNIPSGVETITEKALSSNYLEVINIPDSLISFENAIDSIIHLKEINVSSTNSVYSSINGILFNKTQTILIKYPEAKTTLNYTIPSSVTTIDDYAFFNTYSLSSIYIPRSVTSIGYSAFTRCINLTSLTFESGSALNSISDYAFSNTNLSTISIPSATQTISSKAFWNMFSLTTINVASTNSYYSSINGVLFNKNQTILINYPSGKPETTYTIPNTVQVIGSYAFYYVTDLTSITLPSSVLTIDDYAFSSLHNIYSFVLEGTAPPTVSSYSFYLITDLRIFVPQYYVTVYQNAWPYYADYIHPNLPVVPF